jgi:transporter family-2 protein
MAMYVAVAAIAGVLIPLQALVNARLGGYIGGPVWASLVSFGVGFLALAAYLAVMRPQMPTLSGFSSVPAWAFVGGMLGAFFVATSTLVVPKLGAAAMVSVIIAGQLIGSLILDHFGVLQSPQPISWVKLLGVAFLLGGAYLILRPIG